eukprot:438906-Amphidinium_carterae.1
MMRLSPYRASYSYQSYCRDRTNEANKRLRLRAHAHTQAKIQYDTYTKGKKRRPIHKHKDLEKRLEQNQNAKPIQRG